ncbi:uncharacterized protein LOC117322024 [Pecten maximus]|uniref:uncharacterized protein LOC117322024 n=1 Tax=Pecten maximus TaxID=6579 RepID=UPI0014580BC1|nr:uncharacterized protein LOC117322024 [Pecten maximus]
MMALNYLKLCCRQQVGHLKNMRYFPLAMRHHNDMLCRNDLSTKNAILMENQERAAYLQKTNIQKPLQTEELHDFGRDTLFLLSEITNDKLKLPCNADAVNDMLYNTVTNNKKCARKITKIKDRCLSEDYMALPATQLSTSQFFVPSQRLKDISMTVPRLEDSMTYFDGYMVTQQSDSTIKREGENRILNKCEKSSETLCSSKSGEDKDGTANDLPSAKQLAIIQENIVEQISNFFHGVHRIQDYDMEKLVFVNNFFGKEKVYRGSQYLWILTGIRWRCHLRFVLVNMTVTSASSNTEDGTVKVYWQIAGLNQSTFVKKMWQVFTKYSSTVVDNAEHYGGVSLFHVNKEGKIYRHRVDRMDQIKEGKPVVQPEMAMA